MLVPSQKWVDQVVAALIASVTGGNYSGPLLNSKMILFTGTPVLGPDMTLASLTEANFTGYARSNLTWSEQLDESSGDSKLLSNLNNFRATDGVTPNTITGYAVIDAATPTPNVLMAELFPTPINVLAANQGVSIVGVIDYAGGDLQGATIIS